MSNSYIPDDDRVDVIGKLNERLDAMGDRTLRVAAEQAASDDPDDPDTVLKPFKDDGEKDKESKEAPKELHEKDAKEFKDEGEKDGKDAKEEGAKEAKDEGEKDGKDAKDEGQKDAKDEGEKEFGEKEPAEKEPGEKEFGQKEPNEKEFGEKEHGEKEAEFEAPFPEDDPGPKRADAPHERGGSAAPPVM